MKPRFQAAMFFASMDKDINNNGGTMKLRSQTIELAERNDELSDLYQSSYRETVVDPPGGPCNV